MKSKIMTMFMLVCLISLVDCFSEDIYSGYNLQKIDLQEINCLKRGFYDTTRIIDKNYDECSFYDLDTSIYLQNGRILLYPDSSYSLKNPKSGKIVLNNQEFSYKYFDVSYGTENFNFLKYKNSIYLVMSAENPACTTSYFVFDITDSNNIKFLFLNNEFYNKKINNIFVVIFKDSLCFFVTKRMYNWNGDYYIAPYVIKNDELQEMTDAYGKQYRVYFNVSYPGNVVTVKKKTF